MLFMKNKKNNLMTNENGKRKKYTNQGLEQIK